MNIADYAMLGVLAAVLLLIAWVAFAGESLETPTRLLGLSFLLDRPCRCVSVSARAGAYRALPAFPCEGGAFRSWLASRSQA